MDWHQTNSRELQVNRNGRWRMDGLFHNSWVLGGLAFFWLLGSVVLLVGVVATMKLAYLPVLSKGSPSQVMGLNKKEALVMVAFAVTVHVTLLFLFLGMVLKDRSYRNDDQEEGGTHEGANTEGNQRAAEDGGTTKEKEWDLPPCYDCLVGEETPPPPFHSAILQSAHSYNSLTSQCQETWPCLASKHQTPDTDKPTFEDVELADDVNVDAERTSFGPDGKDKTNDANNPNREQNSEQTGMLALERQDFVGLRVDRRLVVDIETSNSYSDQSEQTCFVQIYDDEMPDLAQVALYENEIATANRTNILQDVTASGPVITGVVRLDLEQNNVKGIADADETLLQHHGSVCPMIYPEKQVDNLNQALLIDYTSKAVCLSLEPLKSIECMKSYGEDSAVQAEDPVKFLGSSDDESVKQQVFQRYATTQNNNDRQFILEVSEASCLNDTECYGKRPADAVECCLNDTECYGKQPADAVECCNQCVTPINHTQRSALRNFKNKPDGIATFAVHKSMGEIDNGRDKYDDDVSTDTVNESKCNLFNTSLEEQINHFEGLKEFDTCSTHSKIAQTINNYKRAEPCRRSYSSSLERKGFAMRTMKKGNSSVLHTTNFVLCGNQRSECAYNTISDSLSRQKKSSLRHLKCESFYSCNSYRKSGNTNFNSHFACPRQTSLLMPGNSASEALSTTYLPAVSRIDFFPTFYFSQMDFTSEDISYFTDVMESRESGIQSCSSVADSTGLERCDRTIDGFRQNFNLDSAIGSYGSIAMQSCASEPDDDEDSVKMV